MEKENVTGKLAPEDIVLASELAKEKGITRSRWITETLEAAIHGPEVGAAVENEPAKPVAEESHLSDSQLDDILNFIMRRLDNIEGALRSSIIPLPRIEEEEVDGRSEEVAVEGEHLPRVSGEKVKEVPENHRRENGKTPAAGWPLNVFLKRD